jgi:hypothetical protein
MENRRRKDGVYGSSRPLGMDAPALFAVIEDLSHQTQYFSKVVPAQKLFGNQKQGCVKRRERNGEPDVGFEGN